MPDQPPLQYVKRDPTAQDGKPPLLILMHGIGSNESDLLSLGTYLDDRFLILSLRAPIVLGYESYAWYHIDWTDKGPIFESGEPSTSRDLVEEFIDWAIVNFDADLSRVFVGGFSQGGKMTYSLISTIPQKLAGAVIMSGGSMPFEEFVGAPSGKAKGLPVLEVHGTRDNVLPITTGRELRARLEEMKVDLNYEEFDMAHEVNMQSLGKVRNWLTAQLDAKAAA